MSGTTQDTEASTGSTPDSSEYARFYGVGASSGKDYRVDLETGEVEQL